jgi:hypothetical protein
MMIEIPKPHREAIYDNNFIPGRQGGEHTGKLNGLFDRVKSIAPLFTVPGDPFFHLLIKGNSRGDENPV